MARRSLVCAEQMRDELDRQADAIDDDEAAEIAVQEDLRPCRGRRDIALFWANGMPMTRVPSSLMTGGSAEPPRIARTAR